MTSNAVIASTIFLSVMVCVSVANAKDGDASNDWKYAGKNSSESKTDSSKADSKNNATEDGIKTSAVAQTIILGDKLATVNLPPNFIFVEEAKAKEFLRAQGRVEKEYLELSRRPKLRRRTTS